MTPTVDDVRTLALSLPDVVEGTSRGHPQWSIRGAAFAWERPFTQADIRRFGDETPPSGPIVAVRVEDLDEKAAILGSGVPGLFSTPHFDGHPSVLIQLETIDPDDLRVALEDAWFACAPADLAEEFLGRRRDRR
ncbi:hypothetical protein Q7C18_15635 [Nesterenkonia sp. CL21]|uniref:MmcQ/YjbR family DNA-binding protein n=1 Tax=Nesterenkonia sp. CL21 TaxID=3064894 RepID=UPI00287A3F51|nr:hypothetical protein [Nesterenkonia sp. CL21]MDS2174137.1 hypothetical protein [Nesterenkonia sp. CL21]